MKRFLRRVLSLAAAVVAGVAFADAQTVYVSPSGNDDTGDGTKLNPYLTLEKGYSSCSAGDTLRLLDGTYSRTGEFTIDKAITVAGNPADRLAVTIDVGSTQENDYCGIFNNAAGTLICDLKVCNACKKGNFYGAGVHFEKQGVISNCVIANCWMNMPQSTSGGGGLCLMAGSTACDCLFQGNYSDYRGGAVFLGAANDRVVNCTFESNHSDGPGGAVMGFDGQIIGCKFYNNVGNGGGAVSLNAGLITNCVFVGNSSPIAYSCGGAISCVNGLTNGVWNSVFTNNWCWSSGGAIFLGNNAARSSGYTWSKMPVNPIIRCTFEGNCITNYGVGTAVGTGANHIGLVVSNCVFRNNRTRGGPSGAQWCTGGAVGMTVSDWGKPCTNWYAVTGCTFENNYSESAGGGVNAIAGSFAPGCYIRNSYFYGNSVGTRSPSNGGAIGVAGNVTIENCTIVSNRTAYSGTVCPAVYLDGSTDGTIIRNCVMALNRQGNGLAYDINPASAIQPSYCVSETAIPAGVENRVMTVGKMRFTDVSACDFSPRSEKSPLVNAGLNDASWMTDARDVRDNRRYPRIIDGVVDIGAWEYHPNQGLYILFH